MGSVTSMMLGIIQSITRILPEQNLQATLMPMYFVAIRKRSTEPARPESGS